MVVQQQYRLDINQGNSLCSAYYDDYNMLLKFAKSIINNNDFDSIFILKRTGDMYIPVKTLKLFGKEVKQWQNK